MKPGKKCIAPLHISPTWQIFYLSIMMHPGLRRCVNYSGKPRPALSGTHPPPEVERVLCLLRRQRLDATGFQDALCDRWPPVTWCAALYRVTKNCAMSPFWQRTHQKPIYTKPPPSPHHRYHSKRRVTIEISSRLWSSDSARSKWIRSLCVCSPWFWWWVYRTSSPDPDTGRGK